MRICLVVSSFGAGGSERVLATLANAWAPRHDVALVTLDSTDRDFYPIDARVARVGLDLLRDSDSLVEKLRWSAVRVRRLRAAIVAARPDAVLSFIDRTNVL